MTDRLTQCDNCGNVSLESRLAKSLHQCDGLAERLEPGGEVPVGECKCGAFAYELVLKRKPAKRARKPK